MRPLRIPKDIKYRLQHLMEIINSFPEEYEDYRNVVVLYSKIDRDYAEDILRGFKCKRFKRNLKDLERLWKEFGSPDFELLEHWNPILKDQLIYTMEMANRCEVDLDEFLCSKDDKPKNRKGKEFEHIRRVF